MVLKFIDVSTIPMQVVDVSSRFSESGVHSVAVAYVPEAVAAQGPGRPAKPGFQLVAPAAHATTDAARRVLCWACGPRGLGATAHKCVPGKCLL